MPIDPQVLAFAAKAYKASSPAAQNKLNNFLASNPDMVQEITARAGLGRRNNPDNEQSPQINAVESKLMQLMDQSDGPAPAQAPTRVKKPAAKRAPVNVQQKAASLGRDGQGPGTVLADKSQASPQTGTADAGTDWATIAAEILGAAGIAGGGYGAYKMLRTPKTPQVSGPEATPQVGRQMTLPAGTGDPRMSRALALQGADPQMLAAIGAPDNIMDAEWSDPPRALAGPGPQQLEAPAKQLPAPEPENVSTGDSGKITDANGMYDPNDPRNKSSEQDAAERGGKPYDTDGGKEAGMSEKKKGGRPTKDAYERTYSKKEYEGVQSKVDKIMASDGTDVAKTVAKKSARQAAKTGMRKALR